MTGAQADSHPTPSRDPMRLLAEVRRGAEAMSIVMAVGIAFFLGGTIFNRGPLYSLLAGPFPAGEALQDPGTMQWVESTGPFEEMGLRALGVSQLLRAEPAPRLLGLTVGGRTLLVKVATTASGGRLRGELKELPLMLRATLPAALKDRVHPVMLDTTGAPYWVGAGLTLIFPALLVVSTAGFVRTRWDVAHPDRNEVFAGLRARGSVPAMLAEAEADAATAVGPFRIGKQWIIAEDPLLVEAIDDVVGFALALRMVAKAQVTVVLFWCRGRRSAQGVRVLPEQLAEVTAQLSARLPWARIEDAAAFEAQWASDREACERNADARRRTIAA